MNDQASTDGEKVFPNNVGSYELGNKNNEIKRDTVM